MKQCFQFNIAILFIVLTIGCNNVSKYAVSDHVLKIDTGLLGIWKATEDTDRANFIFIRNNYDIHNHLWEYKYGSYSNYNDYYITYVEEHGTQPHYHNWRAFISEVNNDKFLHIGGLWTRLNGYILIRLLDFNTAKDKLTITVISDTTLKSLNSSKDVYRLIKSNLNNPHFYSDTLHFYKVSGFHSSLDEAILKANPK